MNAVVRALGTVSVKTGAFFTWTYKPFGGGSGQNMTGLGSALLNLMFGPFIFLICLPLSIPLKVVSILTSWARSDTW